MKKEREHKVRVDVKEAGKGGRVRRRQHRGVGEVIVEVKK